jgi:hypothetical protein
VHNTRNWYSRKIVVSYKNSKQNHATVHKSTPPTRITIPKQALPKEFADDMKKHQRAKAKNERLVIAPTLFSSFVAAR